MQQALIGLSFDDGRADAFLHGYSVLKKYKLPATFNITTGFIKGEYRDFVNDWIKPMTIDMVKELYVDPAIEIAGHGYNHQNDISDIQKGIDELCKILGTENLCKDTNGFASPGSELTSEVFQQMKHASHAHPISYARLSLRNQTNKMFKTISRKISRIIPAPFFYRYAYQDTLMDEAPDGVLYSIPILSSVTVNQLKAILSEAIKTKKACILMFHSIVEKGNAQDNWEYEVDKFDALCRFLKDKQDEGLLRVETSLNIVQQFTVHNS